TVRTDVVKQDQLASNQRRRDLYLSFTEALFDEMDRVRKSSNQKGQRTSAPSGRLIKVMEEFRPQVLLVGSDEVVRAFNNWDIYNQQIANLSPQQIMVHVADVLRAMRRDLGYPDTQLRRIEVLAVFLTDAEQLEDACAEEVVARFANTRSL
ncbi:MAG: hypothetical protein M0R74_11895, partial [Dehalococcoidia bacterium]|nr:hypothetical protein [Dehalococcoidia bacterium]